jgi:hypothetical protein
MLSSAHASASTAALGDASFCAPFISCAPFCTISVRYRRRSGSPGGDAVATGASGPVMQLAPDEDA